MRQQQLSRKDYLEKVYAGVLGKMIGVYLGRPVEGWTYERILTELGEIDTYVHDRLGVPLVVTDDDLSGTFTFIRAMQDFGDREVTSAEIGETWLNYLIENKTILWWGGRGTSTEHTAYLNLASDIAAPDSGSATLNGAATANQIGAMIFIDGWAMLCPADPVTAARLARAAASVSHDLDAVDAAVVIAVMEALAFVEPDLQVLLTTAHGFLKSDSAVARQIEVVRALHRRERDWKQARTWLDLNHGYHVYPGTCHVIPNFSLILLALLYGEGDFRRSMSIVTTAGWDTDCNAANLACLLGIRNGLAALEACPDLRIPPRDLMFLVSADGGRAVTDAAREALALANQRFRWIREPEEKPQHGARYAFPFPGATHGFFVVEESGLSQSVRLSNVENGTSRALCIQFEAPQAPARVAVPVFIPPTSRQQPTYEFLASPSLYPGQLVTAEVVAAFGNSKPVGVCLHVVASGMRDDTVCHQGPVVWLDAGQSQVLSWTVETAGDGPILAVGLGLDCSSDQTQTVLLQWLDWSGVPTLTLGRGRSGTTEWRRAWVPAVSHWWTQFAEAFHLSQDRGTGLLLQGQREWADYEVSGSVAGSGARRFGVALRVQGLRRYYALVLTADQKVQLIREKHGRVVLAERHLDVVENRSYYFQLAAQGAQLTARIDGEAIFTVEDKTDSLNCGALGLLIDEGTLRCNEITLRPLVAAQGGPLSHNTR